MEERERKKARCFAIQFGAKITSVPFKWHEMTQRGDEVVLFIMERHLCKHVSRGNLGTFWSEGRQCCILTANRFRGPHELLRL